MSESKPIPGIEQSVLPIKYSAVKQQSRVGRVETVFYQPPNGNPTVIETKFSKSVQSDEQPYMRKTKVGQEWMSVELGWLKGVAISVLVIKNIGWNRPSNLHGIPTKAEEKVRGSKIIEVSVTNALQSDILIPPDESLTVLPVTLNTWSIRCKSGETGLVILAIPA